MRDGLAALLAIALAGSAAAQSAGPPPDAAKLALARRAFDLNGGTQGVARFLDLGVDSALRNVRAPADPEARAIVIKFANSARSQVQSLSPRAVEVAMKLYASEYTTQELKDLIAFQESPSGRSIREKAPVLAKMTAAQIMPMVSQALPSILRRSAQTLCADGRCTAKQKEVQAALVKAIPSSPH